MKRLEQAGTVTTRYRGPTGRAAAGRTHAALSTYRLQLALCALLASIGCAAESIATLPAYTASNDDLWTGNHCLAEPPSLTKHFPETAWDAISREQNSWLDDNDGQSAGKLRFSLVYLAPSRCMDSPTTLTGDNRRSQVSLAGDSEYRSLQDSLLNADALLRWNASRMHGKRDDYEPDEQYVDGSSALGQILKMSLKSWWEAGSDNQIQQISNRAQSATSGSANINRDLDVDYSFKFSGDNVQLKMETAF